MTEKKATRRRGAAAANKIEPRPGEDYWDWRIRVDGPDRASDPLVQDFLHQLQAESHARAIFNAQVTDETAKAALFPILTREELKEIGQYEPLIDGALIASDLNFIYGQSGSLKSFLLQDMGLHVAAGLPEWHGHRVRKHGTVIYVAAEGASCLLQRVQAWEKAHESAPVESFRVIPTAVNLFATRPNQVDVLLRSIEEVGIDDLALLIFDTQARCTVGANESSPGDMNIVVDNMQRIINRTGAAVALSHHADKEGKAERGTESVRNGGGLVMRATYSRSTRIATLKPEKLKELDLDEATSITLKADKVVLTEAAEDAPAVTSLVLRSLSVHNDPHRSKVLGAFQDARETEGLLTLSANALVKTMGVKKATGLEQLKQFCADPAPLLVKVSGGYELAGGFKTWGVK
ncbi:MAG: helicase RepA family protein [Actinomycetota bacterium]|nr:helicase RepA family protein [Actinomycetota bacterium]